MKYTVIILISIFLLFSCKKDEIKGNPDELIGKEFIIGKWNWVISTEIAAGGPGEYWQDYISPESEHLTFALEFTKKGTIRLIKNEFICYEKPIIFSHWVADNSHLKNAFKFIVSDTIQGYVNSDSIITDDFPYSLINDYGTSILVTRMNFLIHNY
jgi:hypothetical protein